MKREIFGTRLSIQPVKWLLMLVLLLGSASLFQACSDDDDDDMPLTGKWQAEGAKLTHIYEFYSKGNGYYSSGTRRDDFDAYKVSNGKLYIMWEDDDDWDEEGSIEIYSNRFVISYDEDDPSDFEVYYKVKD